MKKFDSPIIEVVKLNVADIITTSSDKNFDNETDEL